MEVVFAKAPIVEGAMPGSLKHLVFQGKFDRKSPQIVNYYGGRKVLRRSLFSTAGFFG